MGLFLDSLKSGQVAIEMFELLPDVYFWVKNRDGRIEYASASWLGLHGLDHNEQVRGRSDHDLYPSVIAQQHLADDSQVMETGIAIKNRAELVPNKAGGVEWREVSRIPLYDRDEQIVGVACISRLLGISSGLPGSSQYQKVSAVVGYVYKCVEKDIKVVDIAAYANVSLSTLERMFKEHMGTTPKKFILQAKMLVVCEHLIKGKESIKSVGELIGYDDHANFTRAFGKLMGVSPSQYRKAYAPRVDRLS